MRSRLVQHQYWSIFQKRPAYRNPLTLSARQLRPTLADHGFQTIWKRFDKPGKTCHFDSHCHLIVSRIGPCDQKILAKGGVEQVRVLCNKCEVLPEIGQDIITQIVFAQLDLAGLGVPEAHYQVRSSRLSRPGRSYERDRAPLFYRERNGVERPEIGEVIAELDTVQTDSRAPDLPDLAIGHRHRFKLHRVDPAGRTDGVGQQPANS